VRQEGADGGGRSVGVFDVVHRPYMTSRSYRPSYDNGSSDDSCDRVVLTRGIESQKHQFRSSAVISIPLLGVLAMGG